MGKIVLNDLVRVEPSAQANANISRQLIMDRLNPKKPVVVDPQVQSALNGLQKKSTINEVFTTPFKSNQFASSMIGALKKKVEQK